MEVVWQNLSQQIIELTISRTTDHKFKKGNLRALETLINHAVQVGFISFISWRRSRSTRKEDWNASEVRKDAESTYWVDPVPTSAYTTKNRPVDVASLSCSERCL